MGLWDILQTMAAAFLILLVVLATVIAVLVGVITIGGIIMIAKDQRMEMKMDALPDKMMQQAEIGLKEREEQKDEGD